MFSLSLRRNQPHQHGRRSLVREIPCKGDVFTVRFNVQRQLRALRAQQLGRHRHLDFRVGCRGNTATLKADVQDLLAIFQRAHVQRQFPGGQAAFSILRFCRRIGNACKGNAAPSTTHQAKGQLQHVLIVRQQLVTDNRTCNVANISAAGAAAFRAMRAVHFRCPIVIPMVQRGGLLIGVGILAFCAGVRRVTVLRAGRFRDFRSIAVPCRGKLLIRGVIAVLAGFVGFPAILGAGCILRRERHQIMRKLRVWDLSRIQLGAFGFLVAAIIALRGFRFVWGACRVVIALIAYEFMLYERTRISLGSIGIRHTPITPILIYMVVLSHAS